LGVEGSPIENLHARRVVRGEPLEEHRGPTVDTPLLLRVARSIPPLGPSTRCLDVIHNQDRQVR
jgi:hypothetical protein